MEFIADSMLGRLARWLRLLGYDVAYDAHIADADLLARAGAEGRVVLTRDTALARRKPPPACLLVTSDRLNEQLGEVLVALDLRPDPQRFFTRCSICNQPVFPATAAQVRPSVPERVLREQTRFWRCASCGRVYWRGGHVARILHRLTAWADGRPGRQAHGPPARNNSQQPRPVGVCAMTKILVVYHSMSGNTQAMAEALADGAASVAGTEVVVKQGLEAGEEDLLACHAVALGSPDYFSYMAGGLKDFFDRVYYPTQGQIAGKRCAVFGSAGGPPTKVIESIEHIVWAMKLAPVAPAVGASGKPTDEVLADCRALGEKLAQAARASAA